MKSIYIMLILVCGMARAQEDVRAFHKTFKKAKDAKEKAEALLELSRYYYEKVYHQDYPYATDSSFYYLDKAESLCLKSGNQRSLAVAYRLHATLLDSKTKIDKNQERYKKSLDYINKSIAILTKLNDQTLLGETYYSLYVIQENTVSLEETIGMAEKAKTLISKGKDKTILGYIYEDLAYYYGHNRDNENAIASAKKAVDIYKKTDPQSVYKVYSYLGAIYNESGEFEQALGYCLQGIEYVKKYKTEDYPTVDLFNYTGVTYRGLKKYGEALKYFKKAISIAEKLEYKAALAFYEANAAETALLLGNKSEAIHYLKKIESKSHLADDPNYINALVVLTKSYIKLNDAAKADKYAKMIVEKYSTFDGTPDEVWARTTFSNALMSYFFYKNDFARSRNYTIIFKKEVEATASKPKIMNAYHMLYRIDSAQANYKSAVSNLRREQLYRDSIFNETKNKQITELQIKYETGQRIKDNQLLKKQAELQKSKIDRANILNIVGIAAIVILLLAIGLIYRRYLINQKIRREINSKNIALQNLVEEKEWLLKEIHHRVKNNLQIVMSLLNTQSYFLNDESAKAAILSSQHRIHSMSLIHKKLYQSENIVSVDMQLYIRELLEYFKISFDTGYRINFILDIDPIELSSTQCVPIALILNEGIMNAIKHAFPNNRKGTIRISFKTLGHNKVCLSIIDNGIGLPEGKRFDESFQSSLGVKLITGFGKELNATVEFIANDGVAIIMTFELTTTKEHKTVAKSA